MNERRIPLEQEEPKYKKKSVRTGLSRSKHKHNYETVLLVGTYHFIHPRTGKATDNQTILPYEICTTCGRIKHISKNPKYYIRTYFSDRPASVYREDLSEEAFKLPKWYVNDFGKFAHPEEN